MRNNLPEGAQPWAKHVNKTLNKDRRKLSRNEANKRSNQVNIAVGGPRLAKVDASEASNRSNETRLEDLEGSLGGTIDGFDDVLNNEDTGVIPMLEQQKVRLEEAKAALDEEMENLDERLETSRADITQAQEDAARAILEAIATRDAAMIGSVDWYATTPTPDSPPATGWSTTPPEWGGGAYIWRKTVVTHGDGTQVVGEPVLITGNQGPAGTGAALVRIDSTRGTVFKEAGFSTDLQATVFSGAKQITDIYELWEEFGPTAYLEWWWRKHDDSDFGLISSADTRLSQAGFRLTVSPADVDVSTVFQCVLHA